MDTLGTSLRRFVGCLSAAPVRHQHRHRGLFDGEQPVLLGSDFEQTSEHASASHASRVSDVGVVGRLKIKEFA